MALPEMPPNHHARVFNRLVAEVEELIPSEAIAKSQTPEGRSFSNDARTPGFGEE